MEDVFSQITKNTLKPDMYDNDVYGSQDAYRRSRKNEGNFDHLALDEITHRDKDHREVTIGRYVTAEKKLKKLLDKKTKIKL